MNNAKQSLCENSELYLSLLPRLYTSLRMLEICRLEKNEIEKSGLSPETSPRLAALVSFLRSREEQNAMIKRALASKNTSALPAYLPDLLIDRIEITSREKIMVHYIPCPPPDDHSSQ